MPFSNHGGTGAGNSRAASLGLPWIQPGPRPQLGTSRCNKNATSVAVLVGNAGGGLFASAECFPCGANLLAGSTAPDLFGYLPVDVTSIGANPPFTVTADGAGAPFFLTNAEVNDPTHNSFGLTGGLKVLDQDAAGNATTLAGIVSVGGGGFIPVPAPGSLLLVLIALAGLGLGAARRA